MKPSTALSAIPAGLRTPLLKEYSSIVANFMERRWSPSELSAGRFCEIVYCVLDGHAKGAYLASPSKPKNFVQACRKLENNAAVPRSFQILIPRMLPALYEVRNNRGVGHAGGDVDPNHMDATVVLGMCKWILAELVRVFHGLSVDDAQKLVDSLAERRVPLVWSNSRMKRVLDPKKSLKEHLLLLVASSPVEVAVDELQVWCDYSNRAYFLKTLRVMHKERLIELSDGDTRVHILPPGSKEVEKIVSKA